MARPRPSGMRRLRLTLPAMVLPVLLVGCGGDDAPAPEVRAPSSAPSSSSASTPPGPSGEKPGTGTSMAPAWPPVGCRSVLPMAIDPAPGATGAPSPEEAALAAVTEGERAIHGTEPGGGDTRTWYVVGPDGTALAAVDVIRDEAGSGWLAIGVERCGDPAPS